MYKVGDKVVYPHHGAGTVVKKEEREVLGQQREYLTIKILHNDMTVNVPCENVEKVGLRKVIDEAMVEQVVKALTGNGTVMPKNWNRRFKHNRDKMKTGDIFELAEVVRNLSLRDHEKGLSTGEKQMFVKAKKILSSELMYAKDMDEEEAALWLEDVLSGVGAKKTKKKAKVGAGARRVWRGVPSGRTALHAAAAVHARIPIRTRPAALPGTTRSALTTSSIPPNPLALVIVAAAGSGSARSTRRRSPGSAADHCWPRASNGSTRASGSRRSSSSLRQGGRSRRSCSPRSSAARRSARAWREARRARNRRGPACARSRRARP